MMPLLYLENILRLGSNPRSNQIQQIYEIAYLAFAIVDL